MSVINQLLVSQLYDPQLTGIEILNDFFDKRSLDLVNSCIRENTRLFVEKREKYIENNQQVALLYRGAFDLHAMKDSVFCDIFEEYLKIRTTVNQFSEIKFEQGNSIEVKLIRYPVSDLGVGIHKDLSSNINLIVFFNLQGEADVQTFSDKNGANPNSHLMQPGFVSLMRAPRSIDEPDIRPYHAVFKVPNERVVLVIREINEDLEKETNKDNWRGF